MYFALDFAGAVFGHGRVRPDSGVRKLLFPYFGMGLGPCSIFGKIKEESIARIHLTILYAFPDHAPRRRNFTLKTTAVKQRVTPGKVRRPKQA